MCIGEFKPGPSKASLLPGVVGIALHCPSGALLLTWDPSSGSGYLLLSLPSNQKECNRLRFSYFSFWVLWLSSVLDWVVLCFAVRHLQTSISALSKVNFMSKEHLTDTELICSLTLLSCVGPKRRVAKAQFEPWVMAPPSLLSNFTVWVFQGMTSDMSLSPF